MGDKTTDRAHELWYLNWAALVIVVGLGLGLLTRQVGQAQPVLAGYRDFSFGNGPLAPTSDKPQSKLWWNDGRWWGSLFSPAAKGGRGAFTIQWLNLSTQTWVDTGVAIDTRADAHMDALWDGQKLYVVSGNAGGTAALSRFSYTPATRQYSLDAGFPVTVRQSGAETITVAKDSTGKLWITYPQGNQIWVNRSVGSDTQWGQPFVIPVGGANVSPDDISAVIAFQGNKIGVMWSNQADKKIYFAIHRDGDADTVWQGSERALPGPNQNATDPWTDDHINLKQLSVDASGRVFAAIKTSLDDLPNPNPNAPLIMLLVRDLAGNWSNYIFGRIQDDHTRPIVLIDEEHGQVYVFATAPVVGGTIYYKSAPLSNIQFPTGLGTPFIQSSTDRAINNATSTKQNLNSATGLLVLAADDSTNYYLHNYVSLGGPVSPTATATPTVAATHTPTAAGANSVTPTATPPGRTFTPVADAYVDSRYVTSNFGSAAFLKVDGSPTEQSFLKFQLSGLSGTVVSARLRVYNTNPSGSGGSVAKMSNTSWSEATVTYNTRPAIDGPILSTLGQVDRGQWYEFDVTGAVTGDGTLSLGLKSSNNDGADYASREDAAHAPQLVVTLS